MSNTGIYKIENTLNGKFYIGSSCRIKQRWKRHESDLRCKKHHSLALQRAYNKYGNVFRYSIITPCSKKDLLILEQFHLDNLKPQYNICKTAKNCRGIKQSKQTIEKRKLSLQKYWEIEGLKRPNSKQNKKKKRDYNGQLKIERDKRDIEIIKLLKKGILQKDIAEMFNVSNSVVTQIKKNNNVIVSKRKMSGENNGWAKLNSTQVIEIKHLFKTKMKQKDIAQQFSVSCRTIKAIKSGQNWSHVKLNDNGL